jgi:GT2 family glycosyltransferase/glycosyltransferase involved in cell wall biosynthesis
MPGMEAIAAGAALATTDTKGSRDYAFHRHTALVSEPRDPPALAHGILDLIGDTQLRGRLIDDGRRHIDALYPDWEHATSALLVAIEDALNEDAESHRNGTVDFTPKRPARHVERGLHASDFNREKAPAARPMVEFGHAQAALEVELEQIRAELQLASLTQTRTAGELERCVSELESADSKRRGLQSELARAQLDAKLAETERDMLQARMSQLGASLGGLDGESQPAADRPAGEQVIFESLPSAIRRWPPPPDSERVVQETLTATYRELVADAPPGLDGVDPLALPIPADLSGALAGAHEPQQPGQPTVDVVVCVHNALEDTRRCLWSLLQKATRRFRLIVVNDGSDPPTSEFLRALSESHPALTLIGNADPPHGYPIAANLGLRASTSDYVILLNSDTIVTCGWLERIVSHGQQHARVGILGPLSNAATHQSVPQRRTGGEWAVNPLPCWLTEDGIALMLERAAPRTDTRLPFLNGFCYAIKRAVIEAIGYFDEETFPEGYAEENDYSQRAREAGFELAVVDDAYVYHAKSRSYGTSAKPISRRAYQAFLDKHGREPIEALVRELEASTSLDPVRAAIADGISSPEATESVLAQLVEPKLSIAFVLPGMGDGGSGGSHSIYQEVRGLRRLGVPARIMLAEQAWKRAGSAYPDGGDLFECYSDVEDLAKRTADANVIIATHFKSVAPVAEIHRQRRDFLPAYYVQDYEVLFQFADAADNNEAAASYTEIPGMLLFAKTHWLCNVISRSHDVFVAKVEPSIDEELFYENECRPESGPVRVAAMVRPQTPRRQPHGTVAVLERLLEELPGKVEVTTFGCRENALATITSSQAIRSAHLGVLTREQVADLMRRSDVFLDMSTYQAFGRTALEAMACGCTAIVPRLGGVWEYARDGANALAVDTLDRAATLDALVSLVEDNDRLGQLKSAARLTASQYSILRAALSEYLVLHRAYCARYG